MAHQTHCQIGLLLEGDLCNVEAFICPCSSSYNVPLHLVKNAPSMELYIQDATQAPSMHQLSSVRLHDQYCKYLLLIGV